MRDEITIAPIVIAGWMHIMNMQKRLGVEYLSDEFNNREPGPDTGFPGPSTAYQCGPLTNPLSFFCDQLKFVTPFASVC